ncbi:glycosyltransferase [Siculibacillus lacustris]|nr:glycosyltransferase [Siculibacillus lacustris]
MPSAIAYDVTRLFLGPLSRTPRGIDRVDHAFARHFFDHPSRDCVGVLPTFWGMRVFSGDRVRAGLDRLEALLAENRRLDQDKVWASLCTALAGGPAVDWAAAWNPGLWRQTRRMGSLLAATGFSFGRPVRRAVPPGAVYLNIGHTALTVPLLLRWLDARPDVRPVFMLHDVIPLTATDLVEAESTRHHATMVASTARWAAGLLTTTTTARDEIRAALAEAGRPDLATVAAALPLASVFGGPIAAEPRLAGIDYFVICGAIEPRKNHDLLREVWKRLVVRHGAATPHLVVVGSPGWLGKSIVDRLTRAQATTGLIHVVSGLSSAALKRLLAGARGLLMPSHAEGFGLPILEASEIGIPVIASDIPAHREIGGANVVLIDPIDGPGWVAAIEARLAADRAAPRGTLPAAVDADQAAYFRTIEAFLDGLTPNDRPPPQPRGRGARTMLS